MSIVIHGANKVAFGRLGESGATEEEVGAALHEWSGFHPATEPCDGCAPIGRARLKLLDKLGIARRRRNGVWVKR